MAEKYDDVLLPFLSLMRKELHANSGKGDRIGWLAMTTDQALLEVYYHLAKLQKAVKTNDGPGIMEYSADVANMAMMVLDNCGGLAWVGMPPTEQERFDNSERVERLIDACEGELDGLAVDHDAACRIMFYIEHGRAPDDGESTLPADPATTATPAKVVPPQDAREGFPKASPLASMSTPPSEAAEGEKNA